MSRDSELVSEKDGKKLISAVISDREVIEGKGARARARRSCSAGRDFFRFQFRSFRFLLPVCLSAVIESGDAVTESQAQGAVVRSAVRDHRTSPEEIRRSSDQAIKIDQLVPTPAGEGARRPVLLLSVASGKVNWGHSRGREISDSDPDEGQSHVTMSP
ncbi:hypothetical protein BC826DRAFT_966495 [Russula brevipes]|nr:hypothetical protein BC826DRAFT_966495 [Russula brevipes]